VLAAVILAALGTAPGEVAADGPPGRACADGNWFDIEYVATYPGATGATDATYRRQVPSTGGCASSWAHRDGQLSTSAIAAQCRTGIERRFGPYPITLRFAQTVVLRNRADCIRVFTAISHGQLDPGRAPLFPAGA